MKIEEAIKQRRFTDHYQKAIINLLYTGNWVRDEQILLLKQYDILPQHFNVLRIIKGRHPEPISPGEIKEVLIDQSNDLTRLLDKLERKGLIKRRLCPVNRRKMDITLSMKGIKLTDDTTQSMEPFVKGLKGRITDKEAEMLSKLLDKMRG
ncbi:MAG: MarR family transcriptional regulator [Chitinophagaceae bacterium]|jgi:DNA-binding MarR family transcriptional regulator|nr:MAG: MarR family transcriptional regulator [Chitinophagaceae bacterium]